jgi:hypothetical protein
MWLTVASEYIDVIALKGINFNLTSSVEGGNPAARGNRKYHLLLTRLVRRSKTVDKPSGGVRK